MIFGHLGVASALASRSRGPTGSVTFLALLLAAMTPDVVDTGYFLASFCSPYGLYSHTLYIVALEAGVVGGIALLVTGSRAMAVMFSLVVLLHAPADYFTGYKLTLPGGDLHGLDLYRKPWLDLMLELPTIAVGWWLLRRSGRGPAWARSPYSVILVLALQIGFDGIAVAAGVQKPSGCSDARPAGQPVALVARRRVRHVSEVP
ncbi:MAG: hypothetical protein JWM95_3881 [Gemmatimonadetes bacterium]|nr:hypothetical protein [Gemmatimonadota bacterium]